MWGDSSLPRGVERDNGNSISKNGEFYGMLDTADFTYISGGGGGLRGLTQF